MKKFVKYIVAFIIGGFGLLTLYLSGSIIFDLFEMREKQGNYVLFVIWVNFICSFIYIASAYGFITAKKWTAYLLAMAVIVLIITYILFTIYVNNGGIHKEDTFRALLFRLSVTTIFTLIATFTIKNRKK